ncbi:MAG: HAD family hydrolase [Candidatus Bathyarchaeia archaeon]|jgi:HAD superfamily hydrolase (TIGR01549 family)|nr:HAD family hydrolase [Candidatus Bathyarchaeota archaeon A05DMB-5]
MQVEAVLFDLFDTLILIGEYEIYYPHCLRRLHESLVENGVTVPFEDFSRVYFEVRDKFYSESRKSLEEPHFNVRVAQTLQRLGYKLDDSDPVVMSATLAFAEEFMRYVRLDSEAHEVLQQLSEKYKLGLVSNFAIPECGRMLLEKFGLRKIFNAVVISGEINRRKPSPEIFKRALEALNVEASKTVFVGDTLDLDVMGPQSVGMRTVFIKRRSMEESTDIKPDRVITRLGELPHVLEDC